MVSLFYVRNFRLLFSASAVSNLGDGVSALAFPWLATMITRDPMLIAMVAFATRLPWLLFSIPAGVWTDRADRRRLMMRADLLRLLLTAGVVGIILSVPVFPGEAGGPFILALSTLAFLLGCAEVLRDNAAQTVLPDIVAKKQLEQANGQIWSIEQIMGSFAGPPLAGLLIAYAMPAPFLLDGITFAAAAGLVWCMRLPVRPAPASPRRSWRTEAGEGIRWLWQHAEIFQLAVMLGCMNALALTALTMLPLYAQEVLGLGPAQYGLLLTAEAAGGVAGGLICPAIAARLGARKSLLLALPLMAAGWALAALSSSVWLTGPALFVGMFAGLLWNVVTVSFRQRRIPQDLLGRVNSLYRFFGWGMMPAGALLGGALAAVGEDIWGRDLALRLPFAFAAAGMLVIWAFAAARLKL